MAPPVMSRGAGSGTVTVRSGGQLYHIGIGRTYAGGPACWKV
jgi:hypothetical protein